MSRTNPSAILDAAAYLGAGKLSTSPDGVSILYDGHHIGDFGPLYQDAGIPGVIVRPLFADPDGNTDTDLNRKFLAQLTDLWSHRLALTGFFSADQVTKAVAIIGKGLAVVPSNATTIKNMDPTHPTGLFYPSGIDAVPGVRSKWDQVTAEFQAVVKAYYKGELAASIQLGAELEANVAFWDTVYQTVEELPGKVAGFAAQSVLHAFGSILLNPYVLGLGALAIVGFIAYRRGSAKILALAAVK